jgi:hypothetical protein
VIVEGLTFIGPGSEWFWTAVSGLILVVTFVAIYRQLRVARSAAAYQQLEDFERELDSERMIRCEIEVLIARRDRADPADIPPGAAYVIGGFWERIAALVRSGHLDPKLLASLDVVRFWWPMMAPFALRARVERPQPVFLGSFEWLAGEMARLAEPADSTKPRWWGQADLGSLQKEYLLLLQDRQRLEVELRGSEAETIDHSAQGAAPAQPEPPTEM